MKKILKVVGSIIILCISVILYISYVTDHNEETMRGLVKEINEKYQTNEKINYANQYGNFYILKTDKHIVVLSNDYKEVLNEEITRLKENKDDLALIYKTNKLMYEKTIVKKKKVTYEYYDALSGEKVKETILELQ